MSNWLTGTDQFGNGKAVEAWLDRYFADRYYVRQLSLTEELAKMGDREFSFNVEYKSGIQTAYTGNVFLETVSNDKTGAAGWVYTCKAKFLIYACIQTGKKLAQPCLLLFEPQTLRDNIEQLRAIYDEVPTGKGQNTAKGYRTWGIKVPIETAKLLAKQVIRLSVEEVEAIRQSLLEATP